jgi:hypothetical protein
VDPREPQVAPPAAHGRDVARDLRRQPLALRQKTSTRSPAAARSTQNLTQAQPAALIPRDQNPKVEVAAHIFIDNSNIFGGAQRAAKTLEPTVARRDIRVYYKNFFALLEHKAGRVRTRVLGGSVPPGNDDLWKYATQAGYNTDLLRRIETDDGRLVEQGVDELLHLKIANALLDERTPQTLILGTGDGTRSTFGTSFRDQVVRAFRMGWSVRVYSWKAQLSPKFHHLKTPSVDIEVYELDDWYDEITYV